jgi:hypothetical protein
MLLLFDSARQAAILSPVTMHVYTSFPFFGLSFSLTVSLVRHVLHRIVSPVHKAQYPYTHTHTRALDDGIIRFLALFCLRKIVHPSLLFFFCVCHSSTFSSLDTSNDNSKSSLRTPTYLYSFFSGRATRCFFLSLSLCCSQLSVELHLIYERRTT